MKPLARVAAYAGALRKRNRGEATLPRMLTYTVTFTCNARCMMCDSWRKDSAGDLGLEEIERIFDQLPQMDIVRLTGGEPFVRRDLTEIAAAVTEKLTPALLHVTTNGFLTDRIVDVFVSMGWGVAAAARSGRRQISRMPCFSRIGRYCFI